MFNAKIGFVLLFLSFTLGWVDCQSNAIMIINNAIIMHTAGARRSGDALISSFATPSMDFTSPQNTQMTFAYPKSGETNNKTITFIQIDVTQSSGLSQVVLQSGGPGQKNVSGTVYANQTRYLRAKVQIYGYNSAIIAKTCNYLLILSVLMTLRLMIHM